MARSALLLAESGLEKAKHEISINSTYPGETATAFSGGTFTVTILNTDSSGNALPADQFRVRSSGDLNGIGGAMLNRTIETIISIPDTTNTGFTAGQNGTIMQWDGNRWNDINTPFNYDIEDIYCSSSTNCWFVGINGYISHWDGTTYTTSTNTSRDLFAVSCNPLNTSQCFAVGEQGRIETWNGSSWTRSTSPNGRNLNSIHCPDSECYAVGDRGTILHYDNNNWVDESMGNTDLNGIECVTDTDCWVVGDRDNNSFTILRRTSSGWTDVSLYDRNNDQNLNAISCSATTLDCWAVGDRGVFLSYDGTMPWTLLRNRRNRNNNNLLDIWCSTLATDCWAVGSANGGRRRRGRGSNSAPLHWQGGSWTTTTTTTRNRSQLSAIVFFPGFSGSTSVTHADWQEIIP